LPSPSYWSRRDAQFVEHALAGAGEIGEHGGEGEADRGALDGLQRRRDLTERVGAHPGEQVDQHGSVGVHERSGVDRRGELTGDHSTVGQQQRLEIRRDRQRRQLGDVLRGRIGLRARCPACRQLGKVADQPAGERPAGQFSPCSSDRVGAMTGEQFRHQFRRHSPPVDDQRRQPLVLQHRPGRDHVMPPVGRGGHADRSIVGVGACDRGPRRPRQHPGSAHRDRCGHLREHPLRRRRADRVVDEISDQTGRLRRVPTIGAQHRRGQQLAPVLRFRHAPPTTRLRAFPGDPPHHNPYPNGGVMRRSRTSRQHAARCRSTGRRGEP
jgi:hypothetical protein